MASAIFGLVGVVVGGLLTGALSLWQQRRSDRAEARAASRLLSAELSEQHLFLDALVRRGPEATGPNHLPAVAAWPEHRAGMARLLDDETWQAVAGAYVELGLLHSGQELDLQTLDDRVQDARLRLQRVWRNE